MQSEDWRHAARAARSSRQDEGIVVLMGRVGLGSWRSEEYWGGVRVAELNIEVLTR